MHEVDSFITHCLHHLPVISLCTMAILPIPLCTSHSSSDPIPGCQHHFVHVSLADAVTDRLCERESVRVLSSLLDSLIAHTHTHTDDQRDHLVISHSDILPDLDSPSHAHHD